MSLIVGPSLMLAALILFLLGVARRGQVRAFLRRDSFQAVHAIVIVGLATVGAVTTIGGLAEHFG